jgi:hypothetical protein
MGNTMWTEASPLTVWKAQPRTFAWEYLPFEVEQPISRYYEYNIARGEKSGRAAWNKRPFNGINFESINLPWNLYTNFIYGTFERYDNFEREFVDYAGDLGYADGNDDSYGDFPKKARGVGDSYRHVIHGRVAKSKMFGDMTLGLNYVGITYRDDAIFANKEGSMRQWWVPNYGDRAPFVGMFPIITDFRGDSAIFFKEPKTLSLDLRGPIIRGAQNDILAIHADLAVNWTDTMWMVADTLTRSARLSRPDLYENVGHTSSTPNVSFYSRINYNGAFGGRLPMMLDIAYIAPGFYSPFSFATPMDAFYAFGSNMVGAGKFIARGEGSPYTQNMMGAGLTFNPQLKGYGHFRLKYGHHLNIQEGRDLLFFPHRLHGADMFGFFHSSFNRWGNGLIDNSTGMLNNNRTYSGRLGDESFLILSSYNTNAGVRQVAGPGAGGLRSDFLSMYQGFVAYRDSLEAYNNWLSGRFMMPPTSRGAPWNPIGVSHFTLDDPSVFSTVTNQTHQYVRRDEDGEPVDTLHTTTSWVPTSKKHTFNLELNAAYDIGPLVGYNRDLFIGGYAGISGVTRGFSGSSLLSFNDKGENTLLWSLYLRLEPAIALRKNFYVLGLFAYENWRSRHSWMMVARNSEGDIIGVRNPTFNGTVSPAWEGEAARPNINDVVRVPINMHDFAYGIGFDWDIFPRVGIHGRMKWMTHTDQGLNDAFDEWGLDVPGTLRNDWTTPVFSLELKTWF